MYLLMMLIKHLILFLKSVQKTKVCKSCPFYTCEICGITKQGNPSYWSIKEPKIELFD